LQAFQKKGGLRLSFSKVDTVFYPYVLWSILQGVIEATLSSYTNGSVSYTDVFQLFLEPRAQFWFLYALFLIFIIVSILFSLLSKYARAIGLVFAVLLYVVVGDIYIGAMPNHVFHNMIFFILGIAFFHCYSLDASQVSRWMFLWLVLFIVGQYSFHRYQSILGYYSRIAELLLVIVSMLLVISLSYRGALKPKKWIVWVGASSMAIYLMHILAGSGVRIILSRVLGVDDYLVHLFIGTLVAVVAPLMVLVFVEKYRIPFVFSMPISRWFYEKKRRRGTTGSQ